MKHLLIVIIELFLFAMPLWPARDPNIYPNSDLTPGATLQVTMEQVCKPGYSKSVRNVSESTKKQVFEEYGIDYAKHSGYEVDHLVSLELGGANDIHNLWPEPYLPNDIGARRKDTVENKLHELVCDGTMTLFQAQQIIAKDWYRFYLSGRFDK